MSKIVRWDNGEVICEKEDMSLKELAEYCALKGISMDYAQLNGAELNGAALNNAVLIGANLNWAELNNAILNNAVLIGARLNNAQINDAELNNAILNNAVLNNAELRGAELRGAKLNWAKLNNAELNGGALNNAELSGAELNWVSGALKGFINAQLGRYHVVCCSNGQVAIGCEQHSIGEWINFTDEEISDMDSGALEWWRGHKTIILANSEHVNKGLE